MQQAVEGVEAEGPKWELSFIENCLRHYMKWIGRSARIELSPRLEEAKPDDPSLIYVARHRDSLFLPLTLKDTPQLKIAILSSGSRNGRFLSRLCSEFSGSTVTFVRVRRGGSAKGKTRARLEAAQEALEVLKERSVLITADRPDTEFGRGAVLIAKRSGRPIVPIVVRPRFLSFFPLLNWDRLRVPLPLCRLKVEIRPPIAVAAEASPEEVKRIVQMLAIELGAQAG